MTKILSILLLLLAVSTAFPLGTAYDYSNINQIVRRATPQQDVVDLVNVERKKAGCKAVVVNSRLSQASQGHSSDMATRNYFDHSSPEGVGPGERISNVGYKFSAWGENIAAGQKTAAEAVKAWLNSAGHRKNMLNCGFTETGVGAVKDSSGKWYWTQVFAHPA